MLAKEMDFPLGTLATVSGVKLNADNTEAKVGVSVIPTVNTEGILADIKKRQGMFQWMLNRKMNIKPMPRIEFEADYGLDNAARVDKLLRNI